MGSGSWWEKSTKSSSKKGKNSKDGNNWSENGWEEGNWKENDWWSKPKKDDKGKDKDGKKKGKGKDKSGKGKDKSKPGKSEPRKEEPDAKNDPWQADREPAAKGQKEGIFDVSIIIKTTNKKKHPNYVTGSTFTKNSIPTKLTPNQVKLGGNREASGFKW